MKIDHLNPKFTIQEELNTKEKKTRAKLDGSEDIFDLELRIEPKKIQQILQLDPSNYCGSDDDCTGCGCNTVCSSC